MFAIIVVGLTLVQYDFMIGLGWDPVGRSNVPWRSALALGPHGWLQVANFLLSGLLLVVFATGLHRGASAGRGSRSGPVLMGVSGIGLMLAAFKTDPDVSGGPQTLSGAIHVLTFLISTVALIAACLLLWRRLREDPRWHGYGQYSLGTGLLVALLFLASFVFGQVAS